MRYLLSVIYGLAVCLRAELYQRGILKARALRHPVISVGNLTVGGTGKTPLVALLAEQLKKAGYQPIILSRGYKGKAEGSTLIVSEGGKIQCRPEDCGDEPYWLATKVRGAAVVVGQNRYRGGRLIEDGYEKAIHILDDGYQHLQLRRHLNILVIDASDPFGGHSLVPKGRLREPLDAIERADVVVITRSHYPFDEEEVEATLRKRNRRAALFYFYHDAIALADLKTGRVFSTRGFLGKRVVALAAVGNPESFIRDLGHYQLKVVERFIFRDHHRFTQEELDRVLKSRHEVGADAVVTTEKDAVRLSGLSFGAEQVYALAIEPRAEDPDEWEKFFLGEVEAMKT